MVMDTGNEQQRIDDVNQALRVVATNLNYLKSHNVYCSVGDTYDDELVVYTLECEKVTKMEPSHADKPHGASKAKQ